MTYVTYPAVVVARLANDGKTEQCPIDVRDMCDQIARSNTSKKVLCATGWSAHLWYKIIVRLRGLDHDGRGRDTLRSGKRPTTRVSC
jgi:hypothetical protein